MTVPTINSGTMSVTPGFANSAQAFAKNWNDGFSDPSAAKSAYEPVGDTYRGIFSDWFNGKNIAKEDWQRAEQSADNQLSRDLYLYEKQKEFAREQMSWEKNMSDTSYQRAVADMKKAGINPVMAINQGGASTPSSVGASAGRSSSNSRSAQGFNTTALFGSILSLVAGVYGVGAKNATALAIAQMKKK